MTLSPHKVPRLGTSIAFALVFAAIAIPFAQASDSSSKYGQLDPWAYKLMHSAAPTLITEHSAGQDPNRRPVVAVSNAPAPIRASAFNWGDAGIGAGGTLGLLLIATGATNTVRRKRRDVAAVGS